MPTSHVSLSVTQWIVACQAPLSMEFSRQEYWSGLPCPPPGDFPNPRIKPVSLMSPALAGRFFTTSTFWEALIECVLPNSNVEILTAICWYLEVRFGGDG